MLKELIVHNYQSHVKSKFVFVPGVNVITGLSQSGKTAGIIRSLVLLFTNRPSGLRFKNKYMEGPVKVEAKFEEGNEVAIVKDQGVNQYILNGQVFERFGSAVPEEVKQVLNMGDINLQAQLDSPFLITDSASQISRAINKITRLEDVDIWITEANSRVRTNTNNIRVTEQDITSLTENYDRMEGIEEIPTVLNLIKDQKAKAQSAMSRFTSIDNQYQKYRRALRRKQKIEIALQAKAIETEIVVLLESKEKLIEIHSEANNLKTLYTRRTTLNGFLDKATGLFEDLNVIQGRIDTLMAKKEALSRYKVLKNRKASLQPVLNQLKADFIRTIKETGTCPTCFSPVTSKAAIKRIKDNL